MTSKSEQKALERARKAKGQVAVRGWIRKSDKPAFDEMVRAAEKEEGQ